MPDTCPTQRQKQPRMKKKKETEMGKWFFDLGYRRKWFLRSAWISREGFRQSGNVAYVELNTFNIVLVQSNSYLGKSNSFLGNILF